MNIQILLAANTSSVAIATENTYPSHKGLAGRAQFETCTLLSY